MSATDDSRNGATGTTPTSLRANMQDKASGAYTYAQRSLDRVVPPSARQRAYDSILEYAQTRPILFAFVLAQLSLSFLPVLLFLTFSLLTVAFALGVAIIFSLFWIGVAFMVLVPTVLVTSSIAVLVWGWAVGSFLVARWLYAHSPVGVKGDVRVEGMGRGVEIKKDQEGVDGKIERF